MIYVRRYRYVFPWNRGGGDMTDHDFLRDFQEKVEKRLKENEISVIQYWHDRMGRVVSMKPDGIASLQLEIKKVYDMMENRVKTLKKG